MATLDQLRLEQLLQPFNNQTGIVNTNQALPMINNNPFINTGAIGQRLQNTDLIQQLIEQNQQKLNLANTADTAPFFFPQINNQVPQINNQVPLNFDTSYGVANEEDKEQEFLPDQEPSGIAKLFEFLGKLPTPFNLLRRGLGSLRGLMIDYKIDFGQSKTSLMDYLDMRKYGGAASRKKQEKTLQQETWLRLEDYKTNRSKTISCSN
jgi:hypothetical protein